MKFVSILRTAFGVFLAFIIGTIIVLPMIAIEIKKMLTKPKKEKDGS